MPKKKGSIFEKDKNPEFLDNAEEFLETEEHDDVHAEHKIKIRVGDQEEDVYTEEGREELLEDEEISPLEEGFVEGTQHEGERATCAHCEQVLGDRGDKVIEREFKDEIFFFCSEKCARSGPKKSHKK